MGRRALTILVVACLGLAGLSAGASGTETTPVSARTAAIGGTHVALADDLSTIFSNPAGFRAAGPELSLTEITLGLSGPIFDLAGIVVEGVSSGGVESLLSSEAVQGLLKSFYARFNLVGPIAFGYVGGGLGFGFYNTTDVRVTSSGVVPTITALARETFTLAGGYAFRIPLPPESGMTLDIGAQLKAFVRGELPISRDLLGLIGLLQNPSVDFLLQSPFSLDVGAGVDLGVRFTYSTWLAAGISARDLYAPYLRNSFPGLQTVIDGGGPTGDSYGLLPLNLSAGVAFMPNLGQLGYYISDLAVYLDYTDILDFVVQPAQARNPILHIGVGTELVLLDILALRAGFSQGLFSAGLGIDLSVVRLNLSMFGEELSTEPGLSPTYNVVLGLEFRL